MAQRTGERRSARAAWSGRRDRPQVQAVSVGQAAAEYLRQSVCHARCVDVRRAKQLVACHLQGEGVQAEGKWCDGKATASTNPQMIQWMPDRPRLTVGVF